MGQFIFHSLGLFLCSFLLLPFSSYSEECKTHIDLTHNFENGIISWPDYKEFSIVKSQQTIQVQNEKYSYKTENVSFSTHAGTHIDAPCQFSSSKWCVDSIPLSHLIAPAVILNVSEEIKNSTNLEIKSNHFKEWENKNRRIANGSILLIYTGWDKYWPNKEKYLGGKSLRFPGLDAEAAEWLVKERSIAGIGIDTASIDYGSTDKSFKVHRIFAEKNVYILENIANMSSVVEKKNCIKLYVFPMKIMDAGGAPCRIIAEIDKTSSASSILKPSLWISVIFLNLILKFL